MIMSPMGANISLLNGTMKPRERRNKSSLLSIRQLRKPMSNRSKTVKEVLVAARWMIENIGWCQGANLRNSQGKYIALDDAGEYKNVASLCTIGAIVMVEAPEQTKNTAYIRLSRIIDHTVISQWNDEPTRTKQEVLSAFDKAIEDYY